MDKLQIYVVFVYFATFFSKTESSCTNKTCDSKRRAYKSCNIDNIPDNSYIVSMEIVNERSKNKCRFGVSFGYNTTKIWVHHGCKAQFKVCYSELTTPVIYYTSVQSTARRSNSSLSHDKKERSSSAGLIAGIIVVVVLAIGIVVAVLIIYRRRDGCLNLISKMQKEKSPPVDNIVNQNNTNQNRSNQNRDEDVEYTTLGPDRDQHYYKDTNGIRNPEQPCEFNSYMELYDSSGTRRPSVDNPTYEMVGDNTTVNQNITDEQKYDYANLSNNIPNSQSKVSLKSNISDLIRSRQDNMKEAVFANSIRKRSFDTNPYYELAKPVPEISDGSNIDANADDNYMPSNDNSYDHAHNNRHRPHKHSAGNTYDAIHQDSSNTYVNYPSTN